MSMRTLLVPALLTALATPSAEAGPRPNGEVTVKGGADIVAQQTESGAPLHGHVVFVKGQDLHSENRVAALPALSGRRWAVQRWAVRPSAEQPSAVVPSRSHRCTVRMPRPRYAAISFQESKRPSVAGLGLEACFASGLPAIQTTE